MTSGEVTSTDLAGLDQLIQGLKQRGYETWGPVERGGAITPGQLTGAADLPMGFHDRQQPGSYSLHHDDDPAVFGWAVGPGSWKARFLPASQTLWTAPPGGTITVGPASDRVGGPLAMVGVRPCDLAAVSVLDRVLAHPTVPDPDYRGRRAHSFVIVAECTTPASTCFCSSMGAGPDAGSGFDLAITELPPRQVDPPAGGPGTVAGSSAEDLQTGQPAESGRGQRFLIRVGSERGADLLGVLTEARPATDAELEEREQALARARAATTRSIQPDEVRDLLARNIEHPRWEEVAERCLACGNCTMVCPTCFCTDVRDGSDLHGFTSRRRIWASCFDPDHSFLHGGTVRRSTASRYRQWATHKLSTWWDQFGSSGCVGCGRCITWCPVGIDITEEVGAIRASDGAGRSGEGSRP